MSLGKGFQPVWAKLGGPLENKKVQPMWHVEEKFQPMAGMKENMPGYQTSMGAPYWLATGCVCCAGRGKTGKGKG